MRYVLAVILLGFCFATPVRALDIRHPQYYAHGIVAIPVGDFGDAVNLGFGVGGGAKVPLEGNISLRGELSLVFYTTDKLPDGADYSFTQVPILALAEIHPETLPVYFLGGAGFAFSHSSVSSGSISLGHTGFDPAIVGGVGYAQFPRLFAEARLQLVTNANQVSANVGYRF